MLQKPVMRQSHWVCPSHWGYCNITHRPLTCMLCAFHFFLSLLDINIRQKPWPIPTGTAMQRILWEAYIMLCIMKWNWTSQRYKCLCGSDTKQWGRILNMCNHLLGATLRCQNTPQSIMNGVQFVQKRLNDSGSKSTLLILASRLILPLCNHGKEGGLKCTRSHVITRTFPLPSCCSQETSFSCGC